MTKQTITIGSLLTALGVGAYLILAVSTGGSASFTALIPAFFGIPILVLGSVARNDSLRVHAMHAVSVLALLGFLLPAGRLAMLLARGGELSLIGTGSLVLMAILCGALLLLCVKSFVYARKARAGGSTVDARS